MDPMLGDEFCGRITEVAPDVTEFAVGDRVLGLGIGTFRPDVVTRAEMTASAPENIPAAALATIPTSFVSAELALAMSGLQAGDRVLVHTASGGVGLAAIQIVQAAGAEVFATASTPKQAYLRSLGITHVFDSRSTDFSDAVLSATGGEGVTVVLNSPHRPGLCRSKPGVPGKGRPIHRNGPEGHLDRGADGGSAAGRRLFGPHGGRAEATGPGNGRGVPQACHDASRGRRAEAAGPHAMAHGRDTGGRGLHAVGAAHWQERHRDAATGGWPAPSGPHLSRDRRPRGHRDRRGGMAS